jgi:hypothetical protein
MLFTFVGPGQVWLVARVDVDGGLSGAQVESLVRGIESGMKRSEDIYRVDVVPIGGGHVGRSRLSPDRRSRGGADRPASSPPHSEPDV